MPLKIWNEKKEKEWNERAEQAAKKFPLKVLKSFPKMPGMTPETAKYLRWKSLYWMIKKDKNWTIFRYIFKNPFHYFFNYVTSLIKKSSYRREGDFFLYGINSFREYESLLNKKNTILVLGFSYCHKPFECPSGRFTDECIHDESHPVCQQCFIGKSVHAAPDSLTIPVYIPTVHYIGQKIFEIKEKYPGKEIIFLITACEMTLTMFADWGNLAGIAGVGVRLDGRICNTMRAFELSEEGIKPGLTVVLDDTKIQMLKWLDLRRKFESQT